MTESREISTPPRLPYLGDVEGINQRQWKVLVETVWPTAKTAEAVMMALDYCRARNLDPFKRPVHIVPMYNPTLRRQVETVWPGISEIRTTAFRTGQYAGCDETKWGPPMIEEFVGEVDDYDRGNKVGTKKVSAKVTFPEWAQITVWRNLAGQRVAFHGPKVFWREHYATIGRTDVPNEMWQSRPSGQLEKVAEAAALRKAFPEEIGNELTAEEMAGRRMDNEIIDIKPNVPQIEAGPPRAPDIEESVAEGSLSPRTEATGGTETAPRISAPVATIDAATETAILWEVADVLATAKTAEEVEQFYTEADFEARLADSPFAVRWARIGKDKALARLALISKTTPDPFDIPQSFASSEEYRSWVVSMVAKSIGDRDKAKKLHEAWNATKTVRPQLLDQNELNGLKGMVIDAIKPFRQKSPEKPVQADPQPTAVQVPSTNGSGSTASYEANGVDPGVDAKTAEEYYRQCSVVAGWDDADKIRSWARSTEDKREEFKIQLAPEWKRKWKVALMDRIDALKKGIAQ